MNIYVEGYSRLNLGDDLFFKILFERYSNNKFYIIYNKKNKSLSRYNNVKILNNYIEILLNKFFHRNTLYFKNKLYNKMDMAIKIGGSLFMGNNMDRISLYLYKKIEDYYIIGSNFGPYTKNEYFDTYYNVFSKAKDVCFREKYSYELFKQLPNVRNASDIVFSLDTKKIKIMDNRKVVISLINCKKRGIGEYTNAYEEKIIEIIKFFIKKDYKVVLMSYCRAEGDEKEIDTILNKIDNVEIRKNIEVYKYRGNIEQALDIMANCKVVVGTRFHANILGLILNKTIIPIAYSDKTINVLNDINFQGKIVDLREIEKFDINTITDEDLNYKLDVEFQKKDAQRNFEKLDYILEKEGNK